MESESIFIKEKDSIDTERKEFEFETTRQGVETEGWGCSEKGTSKRQNDRVETEGHS